MVEYLCYPLWGHDPDNCGDIDPATLPISEQLQIDLLAWADSWNGTYNHESPNESMPLSDEAIDCFNAVGWTLFKRLQNELDGQYHLIYQSLKSAGERNAC